MAMATAFVTLPLVVREVGPVLEEMGTAQEFAAYRLGASPFVTFFRVTLPGIRWGLAYGTTLTMAQAIGEFDAGFGTSVRAFGRPHDVEFVGVTSSVEKRSSVEVATARVERPVRVGWMVRIELTLDDDQPLTVELTKDRVAELGLVKGEEVFVNLHDAKLFVQVSSI